MYSAWCSYGGITLNLFVLCWFFLCSTFWCCCLLSFFCVWCFSGCTFLLCSTNIWWSWFTFCWSSLRTFFLSCIFSCIFLCSRFSYIWFLLFISISSIRLWFFLSFLFWLSTWVWIMSNLSLKDAAASLLYAKNKISSPFIPR